MTKLSAAAKTVWAKTGTKDTLLSPSPDLWLPLWRHLDDTALVASQLWDTWLSANAQAQIQEDLNVTEHKAKQFFAFMAGIHDVGKASPAFAVQVHERMPEPRRMPQLIERMQDAGLDFGNRIDLLEHRSQFRHEAVGQVAYERWIMAKADVPLSQKRHLIARVRTVGIIVGGHHGSPPTSELLANALQRPIFSGVEQGLWGEIQVEFFERALEAWAPDWTHEELQEITLSQASQVILTGGVIVSDWLASDDANFPLTVWEDTSLEGKKWHDETRLGEAWKRIEFPKAWLPALLEDIDPRTLFEDRFGESGQTFVPRPSQEMTVRAAQQMTGAGMLILEAPMGEGKTEAALAAAEVFAAKVQASGLYIALPTMATSDAMFSRVNKWLQKVPDARGSANFDMWLATSRSSMNKDFRSLFRRNSIAAEDSGPENHVYAHRWINSSKRGMLASMAVGTIDHILMASLKAKHVSLRHLGLANKVVIIDEVHAADVYMSTYLSRSLEWLGFYRVPVILLSATLPENKREALLKAYSQGRATRDGHSSTSLTVPPSNYAYPLLSSADGQNIKVEAVARSGRSHEINVRLLEDDEQVTYQTLKDSLKDGGCAVVIRNTVRRAQETAAYLESCFGSEAEVSVAHSAYIATDRSRLDQELVAEFGPDPKNYLARYNKRRIVVSTQVIEQSLDVDFDVMITDLAPMDLLLQRMGRLHRHSRENRPSPVVQPWCYVTGGNLQGDEPEMEKGAAIIYSKHLLYRTLNALQGRGCSYSRSIVVHLPEDIPVFVEDVYRADPTTPPPPAWLETMEKAQHTFETSENARCSRAQEFLLGKPSSKNPVLGWVSQGLGVVDEGTAAGSRAVRDGDESLEVYVVVRKDGLLYAPTYRDGRAVLDLIGSPPNDADARKIRETVIRLPYSLSNPGVIDRHIGELEHKSADVMSQWQEHWMLAGELVLILDEQMEAQVGDFMVGYDHTIGLRTEKA